MNDCNVLSNAFIYVQFDENRYIFLFSTVALCMEILYAVVLCMVTFCLVVLHCNGLSYSCPFSYSGPVIIDPANPKLNVCKTWHTWSDVARYAHQALGSPMLRSVRVNSGWR